MFLFIIKYSKQQSTFGGCEWCEHHSRRAIFEYASGRQPPYLVLCYVWIISYYHFQLKLIYQCITQTSGLKSLFSGSECKFGKLLHYQMISWNLPILFIWSPKLKPTVKDDPKWQFSCYFILIEDVHHQKLGREKCQKFKFLKKQKKNLEMWCGPWGSFSSTVF